MIIIFTAIGGLLIGEGAAESQLVNYFGERLGDKAMPLFQDLILALKQSEASALFSIIGLVIMIYGLAHFFFVLREAFFSIFGVDFKRLKDSKGKFKTFAHSMLYTFFLAVLVLSLMFVNILTPFLISFPGIFLLDFLSKLPFVNFLTTLITSTLALTLIYKFAAGGSVFWRSALLGAVTAALLFTVVNVALVLYFGIFAGIDAIYGASGALIAFLLWVYYSTKILLFGGLIAKIYTSD